MTLLRRQAVLPDRRKVALEILRHPGAALIVPFISDKEIILLKQFRPVIEDYLYELPAGTLEKGESPLSCARREIREETGYSARRFSFLGEIFPVPGYSTEKISIYKAQDLSKDRGVSLDKDEFIRSFVIAKDKARGLIKRGKIRDAKTICALVLCGWI